MVTAYTKGDGIWDAFLEQTQERGKAYEQRLISILDEKPLSRVRRVVQCGDRPRRPAAGATGRVGAAAPRHAPEARPW